ncbi:MAG TPA: hypothetical protein VHW02_01060 [Rhizomicrobium sp.]|nr:hypothetical protein [Rhizomicrobium sp.]
MTGAASQNLTGVWQGLYTYHSRNLRVLFGATLIESGDWLSGSTHELSTRQDYLNHTLFATLLGQRQGSAVIFTKTYETAIPGYKKVEYEGILSGDFTEIEG